MKAILIAALLALTAAAAQTSRTVLLRDLEVLSADDMQGRRPGTDGHDRARDYIARRFQESGLQPFGNSFIREFQSPRPGFNVMGYITGRENPELYLVLTAHYDHLGVRNGVVYNGADDNASGVAGLIALAAHFAKNPPLHSFVFAAVDQEESGMGGVRDLVRNPPVPKNALAMNVNLDMIGRDPDNILYAVGTHHYPFLKTYLDRITPELPVRLRLGHDGAEPNVEDWTTMSDQIAFHREGIPFIYFGVEDYPQHHQPTDDYSNITPDFFVNAVDSIIRAVAEFDANLAEIARQR